MLTPEDQAEIARFRRASAGRTTTSAPETTSNTTPPGDNNPPPKVKPESGTTTIAPGAGRSVTSFSPMPDGSYKWFWSDGTTTVTPYFTNPDPNATAGSAGTKPAVVASTVTADKYANKVAAKDKMIATFKAQGIDDPEFSNFISSNIMNDVSEEQTLIKLYEQPAYKARFPGMASLIAKNRAIKEADYIKLEDQMVQTLRFYDLPAGFYDNREMLGKIIGNEVSAKELQDRAQAAQDLAKATNPEIRTALKDFYGLGEGDITAYMLNADIAGPLVLKKARSAEIAGLAKTAGFGAFDANTAEALAQKGAYSNLSLTDLATGIGKAGALADTQRRLSYLENSKYSDQEALLATMESDTQAILASQKRAAREAARFGGGTGLTSGSLRVESGL